MGPWDYGKNKDKINEVLGNRVKENCAYENVYTFAFAKNIKINKLKEMFWRDDLKKHEKLLFH